jgi:hypothetical protein
VILLKCTLGFSKWGEGFVLTAFGGFWEEEALLNSL